MEKTQSKCSESQSAESTAEAGTFVTLQGSEPSSSSDGACSLLRGIMRAHSRARLLLGRVLRPCCASPHSAPTYSRNKDGMHGCCSVVVQRSPHTLHTSCCFFCPGRFLGTPAGQCMASQHTHMHQYQHIYALLTQKWTSWCQFSSCCMQLRAVERRCCTDSVW